MLPTKPLFAKKKLSANYGCWISWFSILAVLLMVGKLSPSRPNTDTNRPMPTNNAASSHSTVAPSQGQTSTPAPSVIVNINTLLGKSKKQAHELLAKCKQTEKGYWDNDVISGVTYFEEFQVGHVAKAERGTILSVGYSKAGKVVFIQIDNQESNGLGYQLDQSVQCLARFGITNLGEPEKMALAGRRWYIGGGSEMRHVSTIAFSTNEPTIWSVMRDRDKP